MENLSRDVLFHILDFLAVYELPSILEVSKYFNETCKEDYVWRPVCGFLFPYITSDFYQNFLKEMPRFLKLSNAFYNILSVLQSTHSRYIYKSLIVSANPVMAKFIKNYHFSKESNNPYTSYSKFTSIIEDLPIEYFWLYSLYNGQTCPYGLFGHYEFYDVTVNLKFIKDSKPHMNILKIAESNESGLVLFVDLKNLMGKGAGAVYFNNTAERSLLYLAPDITTYIHQYSQKLKNNSLRLKDENIMLYEYNENSSVNSENGIKIQATALFIPHLSRRNRYLWSYQITISEDNPNKRWKLSTRTWKIVDSNGKVQQVDRQPGVIGLYPLVYKGCQETVYTSCATLETLSGTISGFFSFYNTNSQNECIDVTIKPFKLEIPQGSEFISVEHLFS